MESTTNMERKAQIFGRFALISCFLTLSVTLANAAQETEETSDAEEPNFTRLDTMEAIRGHRDDRYKKIAEGLASSSLSDEHQELLATAMSKMYLGVPVSSFTQSEREESSDEEPSESKSSWSVTDDGQIKHATESIVWGLNTPSPFVYLPPLPFNAATGRVLHESDDEAIFIFDFDMNMMAEAADDDPYGVAEKLKWVAELAVGKRDQSPTSLVMKLEKPLRKRFLFKLTKFQMELHYSYVESCSGHALNRMTMEVDGSAIIVGRMYQLIELAFTNIECAKPLRYLLPEEDESNFVQF